MILTGGCCCGALRYETPDRPLLKAQCHCRECQYLSGGGPSFFMQMPNDHFRYTSGTPKIYETNDDRGLIKREFCGECGTNVLTRHEKEQSFKLQVGTLDNTERFDQPKVAIFTEEMRSFHRIPPNIPVFEKLPHR